MRDNQTMMKIDKSDLELLKELQRYIIKAEGFKLPLGKVAAYAARKVLLK